MFKFLKDKLKNVVSSFSKKVEEESSEVEETPKKPESPKSITPPKTDEHKEIQKPKVELPVETHKTEKIPEKSKVELPKVEPKKEEHHVPKELPKINGKKHETPIVKEEIIETKPEIKQEKKGFFAKIFGEKKEKKQEVIPKVEEKKEQIIEVKEEKKAEEIIEKPQEIVEPTHKKGFFEKITERFTHLELSEKKFDELFWDLEVTLLENNVAVEVIEKIKSDLKKRLVGMPLRKSEVNSLIISSLKQSIEELFDVPAVHLIEKINDKKPFVILFLGINGAGKTTTIAKIAHMLKGLGYKTVMAAGDTFRAAAIQQLETHANSLGIKMIKHDYGSDAAAVAFDAIAHAKANNLDVVLIDTAGRLHSNTNLMDELKKIVRVSNPDLKIFIGESITGNDCVEQAKQFNAAIGIDGIILSKADVDEKGGAAISVSYVTGKPIMYLGVGQNYGDLQEFSKQTILEGIGLT